MALLAWRETQRYAGNLNTALAVAHMIKNRQRAGWGTVLECCAGYYQFSDRHPVMENLLLQPNELDPVWRKFSQQVDDVASGAKPDTMITGALYCSDLVDIRDWFRDAIVRQPEYHSRLAQVGQLVFFG